MRYTAVVCLGILVLGTAPAQAQLFRTPTLDEDGSSPLSINQELRGHLAHSPGVLVTGLFIEINELGGRGSGQRVPVAANGDFSFSGVPGGSYILRVMNVRGDALYEQLVSTAGALSRLEIRLPDRKLERPASGSVSYFELTHKVPSKALKEAKRADKSFKKHDMHGGIDHLLKAVSIDPDFLGARKNLGLAYLRSGHAHEAVEQMEAVTKLDPNCLMAYSALSSAYILLNDLPNAEASARRAVTVDPDNELARLFLGLALSGQNKDDTTALKSLRFAAHRYPKAHLAEAEILARQGHADNAKSELQAYLSSGEHDQRAKVERWLTQLK